MTNIMAATFMMLLVFYWMAKDLLKHRVLRRSKWFSIIGFPYSRADAVVTPVLVILIAVFAWQTLTSTSDQGVLHLQNIVLLLSVIAFSQTVRAYSVSTGRFKNIVPSYFNVAHVGILNAVGIVYVYCSSFSGSAYTETVAWLLIFVNAARAVKYRAYEDFAPDNIDDSWGMHLTPEAPRYGIRALEGYSPTLGGLESASPSGFKFSPRRAATRRNEPQASAPRPPPGDFPRAQAAAVADHKI